MTTIGQNLDRFLELLKSGKDVKLFLSENVLVEVVSLLKREGFAVSEFCLSQIENEMHRQVIGTILYSTAAFAIAGATIGLQFGGPKGAGIGAFSGAALGAGVGAFVTYVDIVRVGDGYTLEIA